MQMKKSDSKSWLTSTPFSQPTSGSPRRASSLSRAEVLRKLRMVLTPLLLTLWFLSLLTLSLLVMSLKLLAQYAVAMWRAAGSLTARVLRLFDPTFEPWKPSENPLQKTRGEELRLIQSLWQRSERYLDACSNCPTSTHCPCSAKTK